jgi:hypothetical protein
MEIGMEKRTDALALVDWRRIDSDDSLFSPIRMFRGPQVFDRDFHPLYRRFLSTCCRELAHMLTDESRKALDVIEAFAHSRASFTELVAARDAAKVATRRVARQRGVGLHRYSAAAAVRDSTRNDGFEALLLCCRQLRGAALTERRMAEIFERVAAEWVAEEMERPK